MEEYSVKGIRKKFKDHGVFYTDERLAKFIVSFIPDGITEVYDPTCGSGNLLSVFPDNVKKFGQEIDAGQAEEARHRLVNCEIAVGDTLEQPAFMGRKFRGIVANPPFSIKWQPPSLPDGRFSTAPVFPPPGKADYAFILHILYYLADDGVASVLNFPGVLYRGKREYTLRKWIVERNLIDSVTLVDGGYFEDTTISTALIVFKNGRSDDDKIRFATFPDGKETDDKYYRVKLAFITIDERTEKEKKSKVTYLVQAGSLEQARMNTEEVMNGTMIDYEFVSVTETKILDVFEKKDL